MTDTHRAGTGEREIRQGECVLSIAVEAGHFWETIWNDPANADLKAQRQDPNILLPGDRIHVPAIRPKTVDGATNRKHSFVRKGIPGTLRIVVQDMGEPLAREPYELWIDGNCLKGTTDSAGRLEQAIPPGSESGRLIVGQGDESVVYELTLGALDPLESISGVRERLRNLGYKTGPDDPEMDAATTAAIAEFCGDQKIEAPDDPLDSDFLQRLKRAHGF